MGIEEYLERRQTRQLHYCRQENRLYKLEMENTENKVKYDNMEVSFNELKTAIHDIGEKLETELKKMNGRIIVAMGTIIVLLLGGLGTLIYGVASN